ncbi:MULTISPECIES: AzlD family protein [Marinobacter]|uniref:AzlD family protein n=1 Tax=Marinobacter TaxID=2742 RepID=UPI000DAE2613|nr:MULTISPECIES: AzlD domain-containing protein [Marinobacter]
MGIETSGSGILIIVLLMVGVTVATRWGGVYAMSIAPINNRAKQFINAMSGSVLVALIAPMAETGDIGTRWALLATAVVMLLSKKPLLAITCGIATAALVRHW